MTSLFKKAPAQAAPVQKTALAPEPEPEPEPIRQPDEELGEKARRKGRRRGRGRMSSLLSEGSETLG